MSRHRSENLRVVLEENHRHIDSLLDRLIASVRADDREAEAKSWARVEKTLLKHFDVEEMFVFPRLSQSHPKEVEALLREHAVLRGELGAIGLALELHTARAKAIEAFCAKLREHAERETLLAYPEAGESLPASVARLIMERLVRAAAGRKPGPGAVAPRVSSSAPE